jgi:hypothetical protein
VIHVALASTHPTEADARAAAGAGTNLQPLYTDTPYLGIWHLPGPDRTRVHVFSDHPAEMLTRAGWTQAEA